jgi:hypothetical protein
MSSKDYRDNFDALFKDLDETKAKEIDESTLKIIDHVHLRVSYTEGKRKAALELGLAFLTFSVASSVFLAEYNPQLLSIVSVFLIGLFIVSSLEIVLYIWQARFKRPFVEAARTWKWFYHYCIDPKLPVGPFLCRQKREESKRGYLEGLYMYTKNTLATTHQTRLRQDIEQLFILLTTERLKNEFLKQLQGVIGYGFLASMFALGTNALFSVVYAIEFSFQIALGIFAVLLILFLLWKVFPTTRSREPWSYFEETNAS